MKLINNLSDLKEEVKLEDTNLKTVYGDFRVMPDDSILVNLEEPKKENELINVV